MPEGFQLVPFTLEQKSWVASQQVTVSLKDLPTIVDGAIAHTVFLDVELNLDPSYTTAPTNVGHNFAVNNVQVYDGERQLLPAGVGLHLFGVKTEALQVL